ncbi:hypothetical protein CPB83DRAFT_799200 [Crepidotus variabilis]|uniref:ARID domain-containing protein n=1 Tax=Crepidotus variabilis TaxID=179855 RepID=A0A9P6JK75_9AGAR|nr:hypothetical protein CPB83DRAFT_799200 [Crepidotus variabilis]
MADRLPQYSMIPQNYNNNLIHAQQQHHLQQQQSQGNQQSQQQGLSMGQEQQQGQQPGGGGMNQPSMEQRAWVMQQLSRQTAGGDMNGISQAQMAEFILKRNQLARAQQQQGQSQHGQQPFGGMNVGMAQMGNGGPVLPGNAQQPSFHENSGQSQMPPGFPTMGGMPNGSMNSAASLQGRNSNMMAAVSNAERERQMGLLFTAQPQNGQGHMKQFHQQTGQQGPGPQQQQPGGPGSSQQNAMREAQQNQFGNQPSSADMFSSPAMSQEALRRASPHPNMGHPQPGMGQLPNQNAQPGVGVGGGGPILGRPNMADMNQRVNSLKASIVQLESALPQFQQRVEAARGTPMEGQYHMKFKEAHLELAKRKEQFRNFMLMWRQQQAQAQGNMVGVIGGAPDQNPHAWMAQTNQGQSFDPSNGQIPRPQMGQPPHMQTSPNLGQSQAQTNPLMNQGLIPPRSIPTPQQNPSTHGGLQSPFTGGMNAPSPFKQNPQGIPQQANMQGNNGAVGFPGMANMVLDKQRFDAALKSFCAKRSMKLDPRLLSVENRTVDLHGLHVQVMQEGGFAKVEGNDNMWSIIGGKLGFVQFPGNATEPATSGPGVAQQLQHIYKEYLAPFETWYITALHENKKQQIHMATANLQAQLSAIRSPISMQQAPQLASLSVPDLIARGVDEKTIQFIETNRPLLQRLFQEQRSFAAGLRGHQSQGSMQMNEQPGQMGARPPGLGGPMQFSGPSGQQASQNAAMMANRQLMINQQALQQSNGSMQGQLPGGMLGPRIPSQQPQSMPPQIQSFMLRNNLPMAQAAQTIRDLKAKFPVIDPSTRNLEVHVSQQMEYNQLLEQLHRQCHDFENKLPMMAVFLKEESEPFLKKMVDMICTVNQQRTTLANASGPRYIIGLETLRDMAGEMGRVNEMFLSHLRSNNSLGQMGQMHKEIARQPQQGQPLEQGPHPMVPHLPPQVMKQEIQGQSGRTFVPGRPPSSVGAHQPPQPPQMQSHQMPQPNMGQPLRPPVSLQQPPKRKQPPPGAPVSTPSPAAMNSAPTPVASASTPTAIASSPSAPTKSPKAKPPPKPKAIIPKQRRPSKVATPNVPPATAGTPESAQPSASTPSSNGKRQREEETTPTLGGLLGGDSSEVANEGSPPKRAKTEWEAQPSEAMLKKEEAIANIKTEEDATNFFDQIQELIKAAGSQEDGQHVTTGIAKTLDIFLKGYGPGADVLEGIASGSGTGGEPREPSPPPPLADAFDEFFDFSFGTVEDEDSKAATPDLVSSSSTNPSPESNHDAEAGHHLLSSTSSSAMDVKTEDISDPLRLGPWKEIDGGEGAYYQTVDWKWDSPMPTLEQPWAIFNS